jgi:hypothetical protein
MDDHQYSVPAAFPDRANGSNGNFKSLVSAIERSGITAAAAERTDDYRFDNLFAPAPATSLASWAPRYAETDIDTEILQWIVSHVPSRKRSKHH